MGQWFGKKKEWKIKSSQKPLKVLLKCKFILTYYRVWPTWEVWQFRRNVPKKQECTAVFCVNMQSFTLMLKKKARSPNHTKSTPCMFRPQCFPGPAESVCFKGISLNLRYPIRLCLSTGHSGKIQRACCQKVPPCPQAGSGAAEVLHAGWVPGPHYPKCPPVEPISSRLSTTSASAAASTFSSSRMALVLLVSGTTSVFHWLKDV